MTTWPAGGPPWRSFAAPPPAYHYTSDLTAVTSGNSVYDASGRATTLTDANASSGMEWNAWHEDTRLTLNGHEPMKVLRDAAGNVVRYAPADGSGTYVYIARDPAGNEMARYTGAGSEAPGITEWPIYDISGRLGVSRDVSAYSTAPYYTRTVQTHFYELTDQVGSVRAIVADIRKDVANPTVPVLVAMADYDAYGIVRPKRSHTAAALTSYGYGFQGMASLGIIISSEIYTTPFRLYDARKGSWLAADPIFHTGESAYLGMNANPLSWVDPWGLDGEVTVKGNPEVGAGSTVPPIVVTPYTYSFLNEFGQLPTMSIPADRQDYPWREGESYRNMLGDFNFHNGAFYRSADYANTVSNIMRDERVRPDQARAAGFPTRVEDYHPDFFQLASGALGGGEDGPGGNSLPAGPGRILPTLNGHMFDLTPEQLAYVRTLPTVLSNPNFRGGIEDNSFETFAMIEGFYGLRSIIEIRRFNSVLKSAIASRDGKFAFTEVGYQFQKHASRNKSNWSQIIPDDATLNPATYNQAGLDTFYEIWKAPGSLQRVGRFLEKRLPDGRGIRLQQDYTFKGFLD